MKEMKMLHKILKGDLNREEELLKLSLELIATISDHNIHSDLLKNLILDNSALNIELESNYKVIKKLSETDKLTGLYNRLKFFDNLDYELAKQIRNNSNLSLIMFDIDHFKSVNDTYGHDIGDHVLREISALVSTELREYDTFARWGGEEFLILLPDINIDDCYKKADQIRKAIESFDFISDRVITSSFGVAAYEKDEEKDIVIKRVDEALYESKRTGRNKVSKAIKEHNKYI